MQSTTKGQRLGAEFLGTALLLATVVGSGIMAERLAGGNVAIALLGNTIPTGAILVVLITILGPILDAFSTLYRMPDRGCDHRRLARSSHVRPAGLAVIDQVQMGYRSVDRRGC